MFQRLYFPFNSFFRGIPQIRRRLLLLYVRHKIPVHSRNGETAWHLLNRLYSHGFGCISNRGIYNFRQQKIRRFTICRRKRPHLSQCRQPCSGICNSACKRSANCNSLSFPLCRRNFLSVNLRETSFKKGQNSNN